MFNFKPDQSIFLAGETYWINPTLKYHNLQSPEATVSLQKMIAKHFTNNSQATWYASAQWLFEVEDPIVIDSIYADSLTIDLTGSTSQTATEDTIIKLNGKTRIIEII